MMERSACRNDRGNGDATSHKNSDKDRPKSMSIVNKQILLMALMIAMVAAEMIILDLPASTATA